MQNLQKPKYLLEYRSRLCVIGQIATNCIIGGELPPTLDLQQEAEEAWERENREFSNRGGINPHAYVLGYKAGAKRKYR